MKALNEIKTVDLYTKEFTDMYGNTYYASRITVNFGMKDCVEYVDPYQYGYGSDCEFSCMDILRKNYDNIPYNLGELRESGVIIRTFKKEDLKKNVVNFGRI